MPLSEFCGLGIEVFSNHKRNLEGDRMLKLTQIKTCQLADLVKTVNESVSVNEKLSRGFRHVEVVFEEGLDRHKSFSVE